MGYGACDMCDPCEDCYEKQEEIKGLKLQIKKLKETQEKLKIAVDALEFYSNDNGGGWGKKARQALEKIGAINKG